jgi:hypothetical protein
MWNKIVLHDGTIITVRSSAAVEKPPPCTESKQLRIHTDAIAAASASLVLNQALAHPKYVIALLS